MPLTFGGIMNIQDATNIVAHAERDKLVNIDSKVRACTRKASFKASVDARNETLARMIDNSRRTIAVTYNVGVYGPKQPIRTWRRP